MHHVPHNLIINSLSYSQTLESNLLINTLSTMHTNALILSAAMAIGLAPLGALSWAQDKDGQWFPNDYVIPEVLSYKNVHEGCTRRKPVDLVILDGDCAYWEGDKTESLASGYCISTGQEVACQVGPGCPDDFSPCQYAEDDTCSVGYAACLQKMSCGGRSGDTDCIGTATGCSVCA